MNQTSLTEDKIAKLRQMMIETLEPLESHHIGCSFSILEIVAVLYYQIMNVDPKNPHDPNRDIFILSKGHAALAVYAVLCEKGFFSKKIFETYDKNGGLLPEHITTKAPGVEVATGSLGHGLPIANGFALAAKNDAADRMVYTVMSDGELNEGSNWEAIQFAAHHNLSNLVSIIDLNGFQGYAATADVIDLSPLHQKFKAFHWDVYEVDGHDVFALQQTFEKLKKKKTMHPSVVIAQTTKGQGMPFYEGTFESHYKSVDARTKQQMLEALKR